MTEPRVEAGDRALETARKIRKLSAALPIAWNEKAVEDVAARIQSAMNAQERELRQNVPLTTAEQFWREYYKDDPNFPPSEAACQFAEAFLAKSTEGLREALRKYGHHLLGCAIPSYGTGNKYFDKDCSCGFAEAERLLAERGGDDASMPQAERPDSKECKHLVADCVKCGTTILRKSTSTTYKARAVAPVETPTRNSEVLADFVKYCEAHPEHRFWQALRNWSEYHFVEVRNPGKQHLDTFNWEGRRHDK